MGTIDALSVDAERNDEKAQFENSFYNITDGERVRMRTQVLVWSLAGKASYTFPIFR